MSSSSSRTIADDGDDMFTKKCYFCIPCFGSSSKSISSSNGSEWWEWENMRVQKNKKRWWAKGWSKIREWSELVTGSRWKIFNHRFNKNRAIGYTKQGSFHYDPSSYARNFDDRMEDKRDEDYAYDFSSRYASVPASAKSSMDLGKDGPSFM